MPLNKPVPFFLWLHKPSSRQSPGERIGVGAPSSPNGKAQPFRCYSTRRSGSVPSKDPRARFTGGAAKRRPLYGTLRRLPCGAELVERVGRSGAGWPWGRTTVDAVAAGARRLVRLEPPAWLLGKGEAGGFGVSALGQGREGLCASPDPDGRGLRESPRAEPLSRSRLAARLPVRLCAWHPRGRGQCSSDLSPRPDWGDPSGRDRDCLGPPRVRASHTRCARRGDL